MPTQISPGTSATFGDFLKQLRRRAALTQAELAAAVNLSVAQISRLEQNERLPTLSSIAQDFIPALALQDAPRLARRLVELAAEARGERPPTSISVVRASHYVATAAETATSHYPSNLPALPTRLVGREQLLEQACTRLLDGSGRLLTLLGPPGIGKTTLGLAVAFQIEALFEDGATYVPLAALSEADGVAAAIMAALNLSEQASARTPQSQLIEYLRRKRMLLVLDNFEQVTAAASLVAELLSGCTGLHILVTSRESLRLRNERRLRVPPLAPAPAIELFTELAQAVEPDFELTSENASLIAQICRRLDYLPLALELVAARVDILSPSQILNYLEEDRLQIVGDMTVDLPAHQQTLYRAIERSYQLLDEREQALFRSLAVFSGGFDLVAVQVVTSNEKIDLDETRPTPELVARMSSLTNKSLIYAQHLHKESGKEEPRFYLMETIGAYASQQLRQHDETQIYASRHAAYFMTFAQRQVGRRFAAGQQWLEDLRQEQENLDMALRWLLENDPPGALRLAISLQPFWENGGYQRQASRWLQQILAANPSPNIERAYGLLYSGVYAQQRSEYKAATHFLDDAHALFATLGHLAGIAETLRAQGWLASDNNLGSRTVELLEASLALYRQLSDKAMMSMVMADLVHVLYDPVHHYERARLYAEESVALAQELGQPYAIAYAKRQVGVNETRVGNYAAAARAYREALAVMRHLNSVRDIPWLLQLVGEAAWHQGDWPAAYEAWQEALQIFQEQQLDYGLMLSHHHLGQLARIRGDFQAAAVHYAQSLRRCWGMQQMYLISRCLAGQGGVALGQGDLQLAAHLLAAAFRLFGSLAPFLAAADQADYEQLRAQLQQQMEATEFAVAWSNGEALSTTEAVEMALHLAG